MNVPDITDWLTDWATIWRTGDLTQRLRCDPASGRVSIHPALFNPESSDLLREVVCHEAAHVAVHLLHGSKVRPHGAEWKCLVAAAGYAPTTRMDPRNLPRQLQTALQPRTLYRHSCPVCGTTRMARRRVGSWRCRACHDAGLEGKLEIVIVPQ